MHVFPYQFPKVVEFFFLLYFMCMCALPAMNICVPHTCLVPVEVGESVRFPDL